MDQIAKYFASLGMSPEVANQAAQRLVSPTPYSVATNVVDHSRSQAPQMQIGQVDVRSLPSKPPQMEMGPVSVRSLPTMEMGPVSVRSLPTMQMGKVDVRSKPADPMLMGYPSKEVGAFQQSLNRVKSAAGDIERDLKARPLPVAPPYHGGHSFDGDDELKAFKANQLEMMQRGWAHDHPSKSDKPNAAHLAAAKAFDEHEDEYRKEMHRRVDAMYFPLKDSGRGADDGGQ